MNINNEASFYEQMEEGSKIHRRSHEEHDESMFVKGVLTTYLKRGKVKRTCDLERNVRETQEMNTGERHPDEVIVFVAAHLIT